MAAPIKVSAWQLVTLESPLTLDSGAVISAGSEIMLIPQTTTASVYGDGGQSLAETLPGMSANTVGVGEQAVKLTCNLMRLELDLAALTAWAEAQGYIKPTTQTTPTEAENV